MTLIKIIFYKIILNYYSALFYFSRANFDASIIGRISDLKFKIKLLLKISWFLKLPVDYRAQVENIMRRGYLPKMGVNASGNYFYDPKRRDNDKDNKLKQPTTSIQRSVNSITNDNKKITPVISSFSLTDCAKIENNGETLYYNKESGKVYSSEYVSHISFPNIIRRFKRISSVVLSEKRITITTAPMNNNGEISEKAQNNADNKDVINSSLIMLNDEIDALTVLVDNIVEISKRNVIRID